MGSKRSSKNPNNRRSSTPPADTPVDGSHKNPKNSSLGTPSKSRKKPKLSAPISTDSSNHSTDGEFHSQDINRKARLQMSSTICHLATLGRWGEADILKLLKSVIALRAKGGSLLTTANITALLQEIKDWAPSQLSEKNLNSKIRHMRFKFLKSPKPGPESSEFDRSFYELASKVWGPENLKAVGDATGGVKEQGRVERKDNASGKREKADRKPKEERKKWMRRRKMRMRWKRRRGIMRMTRAEKNMILENGEGQDKDELLVDGDNGLLDAEGAVHSYKYLGLALEEYWTESKLNMDTLHAVNPVKAKRLDESFREVFIGMLKLKMEKNKISNEIIPLDEVNVDFIRGVLSLIIDFGPHMIAISTQTYLICIERSMHNGSADEGEGLYGDGKVRKISPRGGTDRTMVEWWLQCCYEDEERKYEGIWDALALIKGAL
ncbi:hypothetical protein IEQ34_011164 [Dendrobium chrysotoxum]|uniref:Glabrous enhancer-binding protein-like DBD domain-containing protein n=1 Tax=Dendrobium chrysotoxum TaxID=161865 RepID=A0AAV7GUT8_DENCH|nr:hypothetical protein IEQ34_011164 [Dendrobium chrysotoxum]